MVFPATVRVRLATDASDRLALPWPTVVACSTSAVSNPGTLASTSDFSAAPPSGGRGPASTSTRGERLSRVACTTVARPLKLVAWVAGDPNQNSGATGSGRSEQASASATAASTHAANVDFRGIVIVSSFVRRATGTRTSRVGGKADRKSTRLNSSHV